MAREDNVIAELTADHREVDTLFEQLSAQPEGDLRRRELVDEITVELVRHSVAEEQYLYPAVREHVQGGQELADKEVHDHAEVEQILKDLEGVDAHEPRFDILVAKLQRSVAAHVEDEENRLFPLLADACTPADLDELGNKVRQAKKTAPTRPHPASPNTPPANKLLAPGAGLVDRARDLLTGRGTVS